MIVIYIVEIDIDRTSLDFLNGFHPVDGVKIILSFENNINIFIFLE